MENKNLWWGYKHINGGLQVKRYFDKRDLQDARDSDFVAWIHGPFEAAGREEACNIMQDKDLGSGPQYEVGS